jgi:seryl-tRNA synthetase
MTTLQKTIIGATLAAAVGTGIYEARQASKLRTQVQTLKLQQAPLAEQIQQLLKDRDDATRQIATSPGETEQPQKDYVELLRLRSQARQLREQHAQQAEQARAAKEEAEELKHTLASLLGQSVREDPHEVETRPLRWASGAFRQYATEHGGDFPSVFSQMEPFLTEDTTNLVAQWEAQLEIVPGEHTTNSPPSTVIVRTKQRDAYGKRWCLNADGSMQLKTDEP